MERPPYEIALMHDHILRLEEEIDQLKKENEELKERIDDLDQELYMAIDEGRAWIE